MEVLIKKVLIEKAWKVEERKFSSKVWRLTEFSNAQNVSKIEHLKDEKPAKELELKLSSIKAKSTLVPKSIGN